MVYSSLSCSGDSEGSRGAAAESTWNRRRMTTTASFHHRTQVFSKNASMEFSPPQSAPVTLTALDQTIYHIVYRSSIDFAPGNATPYQLAADQSQHLPDD